MEASSKSGSLLLVENSKVSGDVLSDSSNFSQLGSTTR